MSPYYTYPMLIRFLAKAAEKNYPRGFILLIDLLLSFFSFIFSYLIQNNTEIVGIQHLYQPLLIVMIFRLQAFLFTRSYTGIIRFTSTQDAVRISSAVLLSSAAISLASYLNYYYTGYTLLSSAVILMDACLSLVFLVAARVGVKLLHKEVSKGRNVNQKFIVIYGADQTGVLLKRTLEDDNIQNIKVVAFIDTRPGLSGKSAEGVYIYPGIESLDQIIKKTKIDELIIADTALKGYKKKALFEKALEHHIVLKSIPPIDSWIKGELSSKQIRSVAIED